MKPEKAFAIGLLVGVVLLWILVFVLDLKAASVWHDEIAKHHAGEYYLDEHNNKQWRWVK